MPCLHARPARSVRRHCRTGIAGGVRACDLVGLLKPKGNDVGTRTWAGAQGSGGGPSAAETSYLLVFEGASSRLFPLPDPGQVRVGRADDADLQLADVKVSRHHARITLEGGRAWLSDLGSQNGTRVNGERVVTAHPLISGDVITVSDTTLVFHGGARRRATRQVLGVAPLQARIEEELERSARSGHALSLLVVDVGDEPPLPLLEEALRPLRLSDTVGRLGRQLVVLLPETDEAGGRATAMRLGAKLRARVGLAVYPADGCDVDTLLAGARRAAQSVRTGTVAVVAETGEERRFGDVRVLVADPAMRRLHALAAKLARSNLPVLVLGETGTGKEVVALALHHQSPRAQGPLVTVNCAALPEALAESLLFGHERGAFSGAVAAQEGFVESARGGTLFLDEVGELPLATQAKLLRVLDSGRYTRLGDTKERESDVRLVAATNRDLEEEVRRGRFREDLYYRLGAARLWLPPLRDRKLELPLLAHRLLEDACREAQRPPLQITPGAMERLSQHPWPGNVRELKNLLGVAAAGASGDVLELEDVAALLAFGPPAPEPAAGQPAESRAPAALSTEPVPAPPGGAFRPLEEELRELEWRRIQEALAATGGNKTRAAELIRMPLRTFLSRLKRNSAAPPA